MARTKDAYWFPRTHCWQRSLAARLSNEPTPRERRNVRNATPSKPFCGLLPVGPPFTGYSGIRLLQDASPCALGLSRTGYRLVLRQPTDPPLVKANPGVPRVSPRVAGSHFRSCESRFPPGSSHMCLLGPPQPTKMMNTFDDTKSDSRCEVDTRR